jgi:hypothetical protein
LRRPSREVVCTRSQGLLRARATTTCGCWPVQIACGRSACCSSPLGRYALYELTRPCKAYAENCHSNSRIDVHEFQVASCKGARMHFQRPTGVKQDEDIKTVNLALIWVKCTQRCNGMRTTFIQSAWLKANVQGRGKRLPRYTVCFPMLSVFCTTRTEQAAKCRFGGLFRYLGSIYLLVEYFSPCKVLWGRAFFRCRPGDHLVIILDYSTW